MRDQFGRPDPDETFDDLLADIEVDRGSAQPASNGDALDDLDALFSDEIDASVPPPPALTASDDAFDSAESGGDAFTDIDDWMTEPAPVEPAPVAPAPVEPAPVEPPSPAPWAPPVFESAEAERDLIEPAPTFEPASSFEPAPAPAFDPEPTFETEPSFDTAPSLEPGVPDGGATVLPVEQFDQAQPDQPVSPEPDLAVDPDDLFGSFDDVEPGLAGEPVDLEPGPDGAIELPRIEPAESEEDFDDEGPVEPTIMSEAFQPAGVDAEVADEIAGAQATGEPASEGERPMYVMEEDTEEDLDLWLNEPIEPETPAAPEPETQTAPIDLGIDVVANEMPVEDEVLEAIEADWDQAPATAGSTEGEKPIAEESPIAEGSPIAEEEAPVAIEEDLVDEVLPELEAELAPEAEAQAVAAEAPAASDDFSFADQFLTPGGEDFSSFQEPELAEPKPHFEDSVEAEVSPESATGNDADAFESAPGARDDLFGSAGSGDDLFGSAGSGDDLFAADHLVVDEPEAEAAPIDDFDPLAGLETELDESGHAVAAEEDLEDLHLGSEGTSLESHLAGEDEDTLNVPDVIIMDAAELAARRAAKEAKPPKPPKPPSALYKASAPLRNFWNGPLGWSQIDAKSNHAYVLSKVALRGVLTVVLPLALLSAAVLPTMAGAAFSSTPFVAGETDIAWTRGLVEYPALSRKVGTDGGQELDNTVLNDLRARYVQFWITYIPVVEGESEFETLSPFVTENYMPQLEADLNDLFAQGMRYEIRGALLTLAQIEFGTIAPLSSPTFAQVRGTGDFYVWVVGTDDGAMISGPHPYAEVELVMLRSAEHGWQVDSIKYTPLTGVPSEELPPDLESAPLYGPENEIIASGGIDNGSIDPSTIDPGTIDDYNPGTDSHTDQESVSPGGFSPGEYVPPVTDPDTDPIDDDVIVVDPNAP